MFSYRHAFHAGNHADVLKHATLLHILDHFNAKDAPYWVIDTHAGAGIYDLHGDWARKKAEFAGGISRVADAATPPALLARYREFIASFNAEGGLRRYPGSPWLALQAMREHDRLRLFEMHPGEIEVLAQNLSRHPRGRTRQVTVTQADGFEGIKALLPPPTRRGLVLIDPSYEDKNDYRRTLTAIQEGLKRFATGCYAVWYPLVQRREVQTLTRALERLDAVWVHAALRVSRPPADGVGLYGSGMFVINPPWTLHDALAEALPWLARELAQDDRAGHVLTRSARN